MRTDNNKKSLLLKKRVRQADKVLISSNKMAVKKVKTTKSRGFLWHDFVVGLFSATHLDLRKRLFPEERE